MNIYKIDRELVNSQSTNMNALFLDLYEYICKIKSRISETEVPIFPCGIAKSLTKTPFSMTPTLYLQPTTKKMLTSIQKDVPVPHTQKTCNHCAQMM